MSRLVRALLISAAATGTAALAWSLLRDRLGLDMPSLDGMDDGRDPMGAFSRFADKIEEFEADLMKELADQV